MAEAPWGPVDKQPQAVRARKKPISRRRRVLFRLLQTLGILTVLAMLSACAIVFVGYRTTDRPDPNADFETATTFVYYNDGKAQLGTFAVQNRQPITFDEMPETMKQAVVAAENRTFWEDKGISLRGTIRAAWTIARGGELQGGSTITQQYIKILYLTSDRTLTRKFRELFLAYKINKEMSKQEILAGYLNTIYFGHGAYGLQAAAQAYFKEDAEDLNAKQAAFLTTVINNPSLYDPSEEQNAERILKRYRYVLTSMGEVGHLTPQQVADYSEKLPKFPKVKLNERYGGPKGFLLKMVERELSAAGFDESQIQGGGLKITTTFDKQAQKAAAEAAEKHTKQAADAVDRKARNLHAAIASVDVNTGEVLALYGGPDYVENSRNWATTPRPAASTFKAYALAAGLEDGFSLNSTFNGNTFVPPGDSKTIRNEYSHQYGPAVSLTRATADSINTAFVDMVGQMSGGEKKVIETAEAVGAPKGPGWDDQGDRIPLGAAEVSPLDQASAFATFANEGVHVPHHVVKEVHDASGTLIYQARPDKDRAISSDVARDVTFALSTVVENGTGRRVQTLSRPVAGKTGTNGVTNAKGKDIVNSAWFVGFTKQISTAVLYVAGDGGNSSLDKYARPGDSTFFGGTYPAMTWADYMSAATEGQRVIAFDSPAYVNGDAAPETAATEEPERTEEPDDEPSDEPSETREPTRTPSARPSETTEPTEEPTRQPKKPKTMKPTTPQPTPMTTDAGRPGRGKKTPGSSG
jgi:membrane peptidoglycan carboxypeptidase